MSYDIYLREPNSETKPIIFNENHHLKGGTYIIGGTDQAWLNITYNYGKFYRKHIDSEKGIRVLYGKTGAEAIPILEKAIKALGTKRDNDYWKPTPGNAGAALQDLLIFAKNRPDGIFAGD